MADDPAAIREVEDPNQDRYPNIFDLLTVLQHLDPMPNGPVERVEITCLASGEATYRIYEARAEDPIAGYLPQV